MYIQKMWSQKERLKLSIIFLLTLLSIVIVPLYGSISVSLHKIFFEVNDSLDKTIFYDLRLPRVILAALCGASLSLAGLILQTLFRNPLVCPYTLGISGSASLGVVASIKFGLVFWGVAQPLFAFLGGFLGVLVILSFSSKKFSINIFEAILAGLFINLFCASLMMLLQYISDYNQLFNINRWLIGGLEATTYSNLGVFFLILLFCTLIFFNFRKELDILILNEELSFGRGVNPQKLRLKLLVVIGILVSFCISLCGPVGFIGIIIPHFVRKVFTSHHGMMIPASLFLGAFFLIICDLLARTLLSPTEIPVGIFTALIGAPFFLSILLLGKREES